MNNYLVDVVCDDGSICLCRIINDKGDDYEVFFLEHVKDYKYKFSQKLELIDKGCVCGYYDTDDMEETGMYRKNDTGSYDLIEDETDDDYSTESEESSDDESLIDEENDDDN